jgi:hypothetical protein
MNYCFCLSPPRKLLVDFHFQQVISRYEKFGDKALELIQSQCALIGFNNKHYFHHVCTDLCIGFEETISCSKKKPYQPHLHHFQFQRDKGKAITIEEVKQNFRNLNEKLVREKSENSKDNRLHGGTQPKKSTRNYLKLAGKYLKERSL